MLRISRILLNENKKYLLNILEYQIIGINLNIHNSNCEIEKYSLYLKIRDINNLKEKINLDQIPNIEINRMINTVYFSKHKKIDWP